MKKVIENLSISDLFIGAGFVALSVGIGMYSIEIMLIVMGIVLASFGYFLSMPPKKKN